MKLTPSKIQTADQVRTRIKALGEEGFRKCNGCGGTGLAGITKHDSGFMWNGDYCEKCDGSGYLDWEDSQLFFICEKCNGTGRTQNWGICEACGGEGTIDFVQRVTRAHLLPMQGVCHSTNGV